MGLKIGKLVKIAGTAYALYKANQDEVDYVYRKAKRLVKGKKKQPLNVEYGSGTADRPHHTRPD